MDAPHRHRQVQVAVMEFTRSFEVKGVPQLLQALLRSLHPALMSITARHDREPRAAANLGSGDLRHGMGIGLTPSAGVAPIAPRTDDGFVTGIALSGDEAG